MARLNLLLGELLVNGMQLRFWKCVDLALAMRRLRQYGNIERACVRMHTPAVDVMSMRTVGSATNCRRDVDENCWLHYQLSNPVIYDKKFARMEMVGWMRKRAKHS